VFLGFIGVITTASVAVSDVLHSTVLWRVVVAALVIGGRLYAERFVPRGRPMHRRRSARKHVA